jgi:hypothetical protein
MQDMTLPEFSRVVILLLLPMSMMENSSPQGLIDPIYQAPLRKLNNIDNSFSIASREVVTMLLWGLLRLLEEKELVDEGEWRRLQMALLADKGRVTNRDA